MACEFSEDGKYFAQISGEGKLKIWNTLSNVFEQEFTPDIHLTAPCTCLHFLNSGVVNKTGTPRKKKRKNSQSDPSACYIAVGTASGRLLIYSLSKGDLDYTIDSASSQSINCLSSNSNDYVYSGSDNNIFVWNLTKRNVGSKWIAGNEKISAILAVPGYHLLTASKNVKLWDIKSKEVLKVYTGHSSHVTLLHYIPPKDSSTDTYFISGSKGDRLLNCWNLNENADGKNTAASFLMEDIVNHLSVYIDHDGTTHLASTVRSGVVHVYQHTFNGRKSSKPLKPKTTIQVVSDSHADTIISPIHISAATYRDAQTLCIGYGNAVLQTFETITISSYQKLQCLLREGFNKVTASKENHISKVHTPIVGNDVHYLTPQSSSVPTKRRNDGQQEIPMEKRLENLMVNELDSNTKVPKANNVAQLLVQGLHSKDKNILKTVLLKKDEELAKNTIKRLPITVIVPLFEELTKFIQGKTLSRKIGLMWFKNLILIHSGLLLSNPDLPKIFGEVLGNIEAGIALQTSRNKLMGRLELLVSQLSRVSNEQTQENEEALLIFNDKESSDSENEIMELEVHSNSENEWEEGSSEDENNENAKEGGSDDGSQEDSDEPMST